MAGNKAGGIKARDINLARDPDFYKRIGAIGGSRGTTGGFAAATPRQVRAWGRQGGRKSRRPPGQNTGGRKPRGV